MHILSAQNRDEFLATPQLVRFTYAQGLDGFEATLLIKVSTLTAKYFLRLKRFRVCLFRIRHDRLVYGVQIEDDPEHAAVLWSPLQYKEEIEALRALTKDSACVVFLFNEIAANVAWGNSKIALSAPLPQSLIESTRPLAPEDESEELKSEITSKLDGLRLDASFTADGGALDWSAVSEWHPIFNHYVTNRLESSLISIFENDEGRQQEEIALWLTDGLQPEGATRSPLIHEVGKVRELSDLLLSYEHGSFLIESKAMGILARQELPARAKLSRDVGKHVSKAAKQLIGASKNLRRGLRITDRNGCDLSVNREQPPHSIVLVPDLSLLSEAKEFGAEFVRECMRASGGYFCILDPAELLRIVQAARMIAKRGTRTTPMMGLDYYLMERAKISMKHDTPSFNVLLRFNDSEPSSAITAFKLGTK